MFVVKLNARGTCVERLPIQGCGHGTDGPWSCVMSFWRLLKQGYKKIVWLESYRARSLQELIFLSQADRSGRVTFGCAVLTVWPLVRIDVVHTGPNCSVLNRANKAIVAQC